METREIIGLIIFLIAGIGILIFNNVANNTKGFQKVKGTFTNSYSYLSTERNDDGDEYTVTRYRFYYTYTVNGKNYSIESSGNSGSSPIFKTTTVLYNPNDPSNSVLAVEKRVFNLVGLAFILIPVVAYIRDYRNR